MNVRVRYQAQLKQAAGRSVEEVSLDQPCSVGELLAVLDQRHPALGKSLLTHDGRIQPTLLIFVGDEQVTADLLLADKDEMTLMTPIAGGE